MENIDNWLEYLDDAASDKELFDAASAIIAIPKKPGPDFWDSSFILHAPLELCARYFLLPLVEDDFVAGARRQIRMMARKYFEYENAENVSNENIEVDFNIAGVDVDQWSTSLLFASHGPILLAMQNALGQTNDSIHLVLTRMADAIAAGGDARMDWTRTVETKQDIAPDLLQHPQDWFIESVGNIDHVDGSTDSIRAGIETVERSGQIAPLVETIASIANFSDRADFELPFQCLIRTATLSMVIESEEHSKYGWTHCLTIPHGIWSLMSFSVSRSRMLQAATTHVATFRALMAESKMSADQLEEYFEVEEDSVFAEHYVRIQDIISQASVLEDAHLVKYVYTCFDCMKRDPQYSKLYIAAAGKLLELWKCE